MTAREASDIVCLMINSHAEKRERQSRLREGAAPYMSDADMLAALFDYNASAPQLAQATSLIEKHGIGGLARMTCEDLRTATGFTHEKAVMVFAALRIGARASMKDVESEAVNQPMDIAHSVAADLQNERQEHLIVLLMDTKNRIIRKQLVYRGTVDAASIRVSEVLRDAVVANCPRIAVIHNHPSGDPTPSPDDTLVTVKIVQAAELLDIKVLDHVIIGAAGRFVSMREQGLGGLGGSL